MLQIQEGDTSPEKEQEPKPGESFEVEFLNTKSEEVGNVMLSFGDFVFSSSGPETKIQYILKAKEVMVQK